MMDFKTIVNILFQSKHDWNQVSDSDKEINFFIVNRFLSKKYPKRAQKLNKKNIDKATAMDLWFLFLKNETRTPFWFWSGPTKRKAPQIKDWQTIQDFWQMGINDIYTLCDLFPDDVKTEIKRIKLINEEQTK